MELQWDSKYGAMGQQACECVISHPWPSLMKILGCNITPQSALGEPSFHNKSASVALSFAQLISEKLISKPSTSWKHGLCRTQVPHSIVTRMLNSRCCMIEASDTKHSVIQEVQLHLPWTITTKMAISQSWQLLNLILHPRVHHLWDFLPYRSKRTSRRHTLIQEPLHRLLFLKVQRHLLNKVFTLFPVSGGLKSGRRRKNFWRPYLRWKVEQRPLGHSEEK